MIKRIALLLAMLMVFSLFGCSEENQQENTVQTPTVDSSATVIRTLPSIYITEDIHHFDAQNYAETYDYTSITYDDITDTFTLVMTGERYNKLVSELFDKIKTGVEEILASDYYSYIKDIQYTNDLGQFTLYVDGDVYDPEEDFTPEYIASFAIMYREVLELSPQMTFSIINAADNSTIGVMILPEEE